MEQKPVFRHELKYHITQEEAVILRQRLRTVMRPDPHAGPDGTYRIRSLYFDNFADKALKEKADGVPVREKFRLRFYDMNSSLIRLEKKQKRNGLCLKSSCDISAECCKKLISGEAWLPKAPHPLMAELDFEMHARLLRPRTIVDYRREAYVYPIGNVRVTLDSDIRSGLTQTDFLRPNIHLLPAAEGTILEVKYDGFIPDLVSDILQTGVIRTGAFSKYAACRQYE